MMLVPDPVESLLAWMQTAQPGWRFRYYTGYLAADCIPGVTASRIAFLIRKESSEAYLSGLYELTQERHDEGNYSYWITRRRRRDVAPRTWYVSDRGETGTTLYARKVRVPA